MVKIETRPSSELGLKWILRPLSSQELTELLQRSPLHVQSSIMKGVSNLLDSALPPTFISLPLPPVLTPLPQLVRRKTKVCQRAWEENWEESWEEQRNPGEQ